MSANIGMKVVLGVLNKNKACKEYIAIFSILFFNIEAIFKFK